MIFLRSVRLSLTQLEVFTQKQHVSFKMDQVPPCSGIIRSISCLFWSSSSAKLCCLFRAVLRNLILRSLILGVFIRKKESEVTQSCLTLCNPMDYSTPRLLCSWNFSGKSTGVHCHFLLQCISPTHGSNLGLLHYRQTLYHLSHHESPVHQNDTHLQF